MDPSFESVRMLDHTRNLFILGEIYTLSIIPLKSLSACEQGQSTPGGTSVCVDTFRNIWANANLIISVHLEPNTKKVFAFLNKRFARIRAVTKAIT